MDAADTDLDIAAAMGFGGFGSQTKGKRKFHSGDGGGFVDPTMRAADGASATGANHTPVREAKTARVAGGGERETRLGGHGVRAAAASHHPNRQPSPDLDALRRGVRNRRGDVVYFLPSFVEDPWAAWKPQ